MTALALREDQSYWDENQLAVLRAHGINEGVTHAELQSFLHECQRRKLDPFVKQIYLIGRWDAKQQRKVYRSQTSIDGFRLIARRAADKSGVDYGYEATLWFDIKGGRHEVWLSDQAPAAVKVVVIRNGQRFDAVARYSEYVQTNNEGKPTGMWRSMPANQLAKCCEALALRKAFPEDLGGLYTEEEMAQADNPQRAQAEVVRDDPASQPAALSPPANYDHAWVKAALDAAAIFTDSDAGQKLWADVVARKNEGKLTTADAEKVKDAIRARWKELSEQEGAEPVDGSVVAPLPPDDPWAPAVDAISSPGDAEALTADVLQQLSEGKITDDKAASIHAAIAAREAAVSQAAAA
jgi:phage recombination protein Bet